MKTTVKYILAAALAAAAVLPVSGASAMSAEQDAPDVYTIEQCYDLVRQNYPLVKRYELLDLTEEYTLKNAYMNYFPQISLQGSASWQTDVLEFPFDLSPYGIEMPTFSKDQYAAVIELSQVLWDGGMIAANRANIRATTGPTSGPRLTWTWPSRRSTCTRCGRRSTSCTSVFSTLTSRSVRWTS